MILIFLILGCNNHQDNKNIFYPDINADGTDWILRHNLYARGFSIWYSEDQYLLQVNDPWNKGDIMASYRIDKTEIPERWALSSTTHIGFLDALGEADRVVGCTSPGRIYNTKLAEKYRRGELVKIGSDMEFNFESVLGVKPDIVLQTAFEGENNKDSKFKNTNLEFIYILEWMEAHPLGRAEWIKVFGILTGKSTEADSVFNKIAKEYTTLKSKAGDENDKPTVMIGNNFNGVWFMPGGKNYMCRYLEDAGYSYSYYDSGKEGSLALNFENVLKDFRSADIWLGVSARNMEGLLNDDSRYNLFEAFKTGEVYSLNGRLSSELGNDFWESGVVYPNSVLADLVSISHPDLLPGYQLVYYKKLTGGK